MKLFDQILTWHVHCVKLLSLRKYFNELEIILLLAELVNPNILLNNFIENATKRRENKQINLEL